MVHIGDVLLARLPLFSPWRIHESHNGIRNSHSGHVAPATDHMFHVTNTTCSDYYAAEDDPYSPESIAYYHDWVVQNVSGEQRVAGRTVIRSSVDSREESRLMQSRFHRIPEPGPG